MKTAKQYNVNPKPVTLIDDVVVIRFSRQDFGQKKMMREL